MLPEVAEHQRHFCVCNRTPTTIYKFGGRNHGIRRWRAVATDRMGKATVKVEAMNNLEFEDLEVAAVAAENIYAEIESIAESPDNAIAINLSYEVGRLLVSRAREDGRLGQPASCMQLLAALKAGMERESDVR